MLVVRSVKDMFLFIDVTDLLYTIKKVKSILNIRPLTATFLGVKMSS